LPLGRYYYCINKRQPGRKYPKNSNPPHAAYPAVAKAMLMILAAQSAGAKKKVRKAASLAKLQLKSVAELV
jgi:hypothetical protein